MALKKRILSSNLLGTSIVYEKHKASSVCVIGPMRLIEADYAFR